MFSLTERLWHLAPQALPHQPADRGHQRARGAHDDPDRPLREVEELDERHGEARGDHDATREEQSELRALGGHAAILAELRDDRGGDLLAVGSVER